MNAPGLILLRLWFWLRPAAWFGSIQAERLE